MYPVSDAFHEAVKAGNDQKALLIFPDCVFTDEDISIDTGIEFHDNFNGEKDIAIGQTPSNEISFALFNDNRLLNGYTFGDFLATIGVQLSTDQYTARGNVMVTTTYATYIGNSEAPYVMRNGSALSSQPDFGVFSILAYDGKVWCFGANGQHIVYNDSNGQNITSQNPLNSFMKRKSIGWRNKGFMYNKSSRRLMIYNNGVRSLYEFCPLGWFTAERPKAPDVIRIDMHCYDYMQKFEADMPTAKQLGITYPVTIGKLFEKLCSYVGVQYKTSTFINSTAKIQKEPDDFQNSTMREVLHWIAEAAGSNAKFNRDGVLELVWLRNTTQSYTATNYQEFNPYWYKTKKVTKLYNRSTQDGTDKTVGSGDEAYLIQDNPLLKGVS